MLVVKCSNVKYMFCPQYDGLSLADILNQAKQYPITFEYLPEEAELKRLPRQWVINLVYTLVEDLFAAWVNERVEQRNRKLAEENDLLIDFDPEIARAFHASTAISSKFFFAVQSPQILNRSFSRCSSSKGCWSVLAQKQVQTQEELGSRSRCCRQRGVYSRVVPRVLPSHHGARREAQVDRAGG